MALDVELASLMLGHQGDSSIFLYGFEDIAVRLAFVGKSIENSSLFSGFLKFFSDSYDHEVRWFHGSEVLDRRDVEWRLWHWHNQILVEINVGGRRYLPKMVDKGVAAVNGSSRTSSIHQNSTVDRKARRQHSSDPLRACRPHKA